MNARPGRAIAVVAVLLLAGCGYGGTVNGIATTIPPERLLDCPPTTVGEQLPRDAAPTAVLQCDRRKELVPGDGEWTFDVRSRATAGLDRLVTALRLPSEPMANEYCTADLRLPTVVLLEFDTHLLPVVTPRDACRKTRPEVLDAYRALTWTEVTRTPVARVRSEAAVAAGCDVSKDQLAIEAPRARPGGPGGVAAPPAGATRVCRYSSVYPPGWTPESTVTVVEGRPESGFTASPSQTADVVEAIGGAGPAARCLTTHTSFAVVDLGGDQAYVELDGCLRILAPDGTLRQGTHDLAALLATG